MMQYSIGSDVWPGMSKLIEEMGEVNQILGKLIATGGKPDHWDGSNLIEKLKEELPDLQAAIQFFAGMNGLHCTAFHDRFAAKLVQFHKWHSEQEKEPEYQSNALLKAAQWAYWHLDRYGLVPVATGFNAGHEDQIAEQQKVLAALSPFGTTLKPEGL